MNQMNELSAEWLSKAIRLLPSDAPVAKGTQGYAHYTTQRDHWLGWLDPDREVVTYARSIGPGRGARYAYNHIMEPKMLLWLITASGLPKEMHDLAQQEAQCKTAFASKCAAVRKIVPWEVIASQLAFILDAKEK